MTNRRASLDGKAGGWRRPVDIGRASSRRRCSAVAFHRDQVWSKADIQIKTSCLCQAGVTMAK